MEAKEEELAEVEEHAQKATASQMETLGRANRGIEEAREQENETEPLEVTNNTSVDVRL